MPTEKKVTRKLAAILSADVKGYSVLMADDELHTIETLKAYRQIISDLVSKHSGRVVDSPGDNILAEFRSSVDAVECAVKIQKRLVKKNSKYPDDKKVQFRIGVNVGDVIQDGDRIYGNGVNVAARIEGLADPGGVSISRNAYDHIKNKLTLGYEYIGEHSVKNIKDPVRVYKLLMTEEDAGKLIGDGPKPAAKNWIWATVILAIIVITSVVWQVYQKMTEPEFEPAKVEKMTYPLPEKPSIAVLPFDNMSDDSKQEYFCNGLSEEIITALSKSSQVFVIARNSSFKYKGKPVKIQQVAEELGVQYVLEGSVRKDTERVRITAQLIDAVKGIHLWAERYDRNLNDIFAIQDDITKQIIAALHVKLTIGEDARIIEKGTGSLDAYLLYLQARELHFQFSKDDNIKSRQLLEQVISIDPKYGSAYSLMAASHMIDVWIQATDNPQISIKKAIELATKAKDYWDGSHDLLGFLYSMVGQLEKAMIECKKSVDLYPNSSTSRAFYGIVLRTVGRYEEAITELEKSVRLDPFASSFSLRTLGFSYALAGKYDEAIDIGRKSVQQSPEDIMAKLFLALSYGFAGRMEEAGLESKNILRLNPNFNLDSFVKQLTIQDEEIKKRIKKTLQLAGLPEYPSGKEPPEKPSIAVLPFVNMSDDQDQEYFSDGISEEIITALSKTPKLFVIARTSCFKYKGKEVDIRTVGRELGVRYVLEGSVRRSKDKVRITAQLIDANTEKHLWAEQYEFELKDIFNIQDEITKKIITSLRVKLTEGESARLLDKGTYNIQAFLKILEGIGYFDEDKYSEGMKCFDEAILLDPQSPAAHAWLSWGHLMNVWFGPSATRRQSLEKAIELAEKCKALDPAGGGCYSALSHAYLMKRDYDKAISEGKRSIELGPNNSNAAVNYGWALRSVGRYEDALFEYERALRLNPLDKARPLEHICTTYNMMRRHEEAIEICKKAIELNSRSLPSYINIAVAYSELDKMGEAREAAGKVLQMNPNFSMDSFEKTLPYKNKADRDLYVNGLRKAGFK